MDTKDVKSNAQPKPQQEVKHPPEWRRDLNPDHLAGQNIGPVSSASERGVPTAYDLKDVQRRLSGLDDDELKRIPIIPAGTRLQQDATYVDLAGKTRREFTATGDTQVEPGQLIVPKDEVPYHLWNRLLGQAKW